MNVEDVKKLLGDVVEVHAKGDNIYFGEVNIVREIHHLGQSKAEVHLIHPKKNTFVADLPLEDITKLRVIQGEWQK